MIHIFPQYFAMKIFRQQSLKNFNSEYVYTHHLDSVSILLYLFYMIHILNHPLLSVVH